MNLENQFFIATIKNLILAEPIFIATIKNWILAEPIFIATIKNWILAEPIFIATIKMRILGFCQFVRLGASQARNSPSEPTEFHFFLGKICWDLLAALADSAPLHAHRPPMTLNRSLKNADAAVHWVL